jgi:hypothetical protein
MYTLIRLYDSDRRQSGNFGLSAFGKDRVNALSQQRLHRRPFFGRDDAQSPLNFGRKMTADQDST